MNRPLVVAPDGWRPLVDALLPAFGKQHVASILGGKPSYNIYDAFLRAQQERQALPEQEQRDFALRRTIELAHAQEPFGIIVAADDPIGQRALGVARELGVPALKIQPEQFDDTERVVAKIVEVAHAP